MHKTLAGLLAGAVALAGMAAYSDDALAKKKKPKQHAEAAAATTNIDDCAKADAAQRDRCISMSRPVSGTSLYAKWGGAAPTAAAKVKAAAGAVAAAGAAVASKAKAKLAAGATNIDDCGKMDAGARDACISRSRPVSGADLYKKYKQ